eukprot:Nk52_evm15s158 gene=Nk52_evmTU15s158
MVVCSESPSPGFMGGDPLSGTLSSYFSYFNPSVIGSSNTSTSTVTSAANSPSPVATVPGHSDYLAVLNEDFVNFVSSHDGNQHHSEQKNEKMVVGGALLSSSGGYSSEDIQDEQESGYGSPSGQGGVAAVNVTSSDRKDMVEVKHTTGGHEEHGSSPLAVASSAVNNCTKGYVDSVKKESEKENMEESGISLDVDEIPTCIYTNTTFDSDIFMFEADHAASLQQAGTVVKGVDNGVCGPTLLELGEYDGLSSLMDDGSALNGVDVLEGAFLAIFDNDEVVPEYNNGRQSPSCSITPVDSPCEQVSDVEWEEKVDVFDELALALSTNDSDGSKSSAQEFNLPELSSKPKPDEDSTCIYENSHSAASTCSSVASPSSSIDTDKIVNSDSPSPSCEAPSVATPIPTKGKRTASTATKKKRKRRTATLFSSKRKGVRKSRRLSLQQRKEEEDEEESADDEHVVIENHETAVITEPVQSKYSYSTSGPTGASGKPKGMFYFEREVVLAMDKNVEDSEDEDIDVVGDI